jgi:hypothetical protein
MNRQREKRCRAREFFWWLAGRKYKFRVVDREENRWFRVAKLKWFMGVL